MAVDAGATRGEGEAEFELDIADIVSETLANLHNT